MLKQLNVSELSPGMMVTQVINQNGPVKIRKVGFIRSGDMIRGLTEMGVTVVEVDIDQSLNVDLEEDVNEAETTSSEESNKPVKITATQRLVASDRQIADVDRQLSQQFHRALFLPAVDQMPSKWMLYGKPYTLLTMFILFGLFIGAMASYSLIGMMTNTGLVSTTQANTSAIIESNTPEKNVPGDILTTDENSVQAFATQETAAEIGVNNTVVAEQEQNAVVTDAVVNNTLKGPEKTPLSTIDKTIVSNTPREIKLSSPSETVKGIILEEGQQVLGYQSGNDEEAQSTQGDSTQDNDTDIANIPNVNERREQTRANREANNEPTARDTSSNEALNPNLLRRIQAAAQDVDSQSSEPKPELVKVTDLNELPRIDQLSPAILTQMPAMSFSAHMYASNPRDRWVRVNSKRLGEGDVIANNVILRRIESEKVVLDYKGTEFTMNALSDW
ncbi:MAG: general secretion pathway protein B [Alphaproteobacteria bacterium]|jgi:general secretion pathway protein B